MVRAMRLPTGVTFFLSFLSLPLILSVAACGRDEPQAKSAQVAASVASNSAAAENPTASKSKGKGKNKNEAEDRSASDKRSSATAPPRPPHAAGSEHSKAPERPDDARNTAAATSQGSDARVDQFTDLETLCTALNKDYVDGTLTDYYQHLSLKTAFGKDLRRRGEASMKPGRILEAGLKKLGRSEANDPATPACAQLFDELDDLE